MKVLITGGCGYLGSAFIKYLNRHHADQIDQIIIYDNLTKNNTGFLFDHKILNIRIRLDQNDILDKRSLKRSLKDVDAVIHLAAHVVQPYTDLNLHVFDQINNWGSASVVDAIDESDVSKVIYMSSMTIYGSNNDLINEQTVPEPLTYYGVSKLKGEKHFLRLNKLQPYILRLGNVYGYSPNMRIDSIFNRLMFEAHFQGKVNKIGDGTQSRAFMSIEGFCTQLARILLNDIDPGIYNMAEENLSINQIIDIYHRLFPNLEVISLDQAAKLKNLNVELPTKLQTILKNETPDLLPKLIEFKERFSF